MCYLEHLVCTINSNWQQGGGQIPLSTDVNLPSISIHLYSKHMSFQGGSLWSEQSYYLLIDYEKETVVQKLSWNKLYTKGSCIQSNNYLIIFSLFI